MHTEIHYEHTDLETDRVMVLRWKYQRNVYKCFKPGTQVKSLEGRGQYHGCWCPGSLRRQVISSHGIDKVG